MKTIIYPGAIPIPGLSRALFSMTDWVDDIAQRPDLARPCMERPRRYQRRTYGGKAANTSAYGHRLKGREGISVRPSTEGPRSYQRRACGEAIDGRAEKVCLSHRHSGTLHKGQFEMLQVTRSLQSVLQWLGTDLLLHTDS